MASWLFNIVQFFDDNGAVLNAGTVNTYSPGTTTDKATYPTLADADALTNAHTNPVVLDSAGRAQIWTTGLTKLVVKNSSGDTLDTYDSVGDGSGSNALPQSYIAGLITSNNSGEAAHDIDIAAGEARDAADSEDMTLSATLTKQIDAAWAVGSDAGGLDTGAVGNATMYYIWLIKRSDTAVVDALFSTSATAPTMPTSYDKKRLIGALRSDGSANIISYTQSGDYFRYTGDIIADVADNTITSNTFETGTLSVPPSSLAHVYGTLSNPTETGTQQILVIRAAGAADDVTAIQEAWAFLQVETATEAEAIGNVGMVLANSSSQVQYAALEAGGTATVSIHTIGFEMKTRRDP